MAKSNEAEIFENLVIPSEDDRNELRKKAAEYLMLEDEIESLSTKMRELNDSLNVLSVKTLPELMARCGIDAFRLQNGYEVYSDSFMSGSLPKDETLRKLGMKHLIDLGGDSLIKNSFEIQLDKKDNARADELARFLDAKKIGYIRSMDVHAGSLKKFAKEAMKAGKDLKLAELGLYAGRFVKIKRPNGATE